MQSLKMNVIESELSDISAQGRKYKYRESINTDHPKRLTRCEELEEYWENLNEESFEVSYSNPTDYNNCIETEYVEESIEEYPLEWKFRSKTKSEK